MVHTNIIKFERGVDPLLEETFLRRGKHRNIPELVVRPGNDTFNDRLQVSEHPLDCFSFEPRRVINNLKVKIRGRCRKQRQRVPRGGAEGPLAANYDADVSRIVTGRYRQVLKHEQALEKRLVRRDLAPAMY